MAARGIASLPGLLFALACCLSCLPRGNFSGGAGCEAAAVHIDVLPAASSAAPLVGPASTLGVQDSTSTTEKTTSTRANVSTTTTPAHTNEAHSIAFLILAFPGRLAKSKKKK